MVSDKFVELNNFLNRRVVIRANGILHFDHCNRLFTQSAAITAASSVTIAIVAVIVMIMMTIMINFLIVVIIIAIIIIVVIIPLFRRLGRSLAKNIHRLIPPNLLAIDERRFDIERIVEND